MGEHNTPTDWYKGRDGAEFRPTLYGNVRDVRDIEVNQPEIVS